ncbi:5596_t:CDS:2, partial [Paraglomus brasilianum]
YSSEDEDDSTIQQTDIERKRQKTPREAMMASTNKGSGSLNLPPVPNEIKELFPDPRKDYTKHIPDPSKHEGRIRTIPHVEGNFATHIHVRVKAPPEFLNLMRSLETYLKTHHTSIHSCSDNDSATELELHISLSRLIILKYHQIERFWNNLQSALGRPKSFTMSFARIIQLMNDTRTCSYLALEVGMGTNELKSLLEKIDYVVGQFKQPTFYEKPRFHTSVFWSLNHLSESLCEEAEAAFGDMIRDYAFLPDDLVCQIGNRKYITKLDQSL